LSLSVQDGRGPSSLFLGRSHRGHGLQSCACAVESWHFISTTGPGKGRPYTLCCIFKTYSHHLVLPVQAWAGMRSAGDTLAWYEPSGRSQAASEPMEGGWMHPLKTNVPAQSLLQLLEGKAIRVQGELGLPLVGPLWALVFLLGPSRRQWLTSEPPVGAWIPLCGAA